jgi:hypothetical protein
MTKADKKPKAEILTPHEASLTLMPWSCNHHPTFSEIEAYLPITGNFEIIADVHNTKGVDAKVVAGLITRAVNSYEKLRELINQMASALELCLSCSDCLTWETEQGAEVVLKRVKALNEGDR